MSKTDKKTTPEARSGCGKKGHLYHIVFCVLLLVSLMSNFNSNSEPTSRLLLIYAFAGLIYSSIMYTKLSRIEKEEKLIKQARELDAIVLRLAKENGGYLTPAKFSLQASVTIEEAKQILDQYIERGVARIEVTDEGIVEYIFPELLEPPNSSSGE